MTRTSVGTHRSRRLGSTLVALTAGVSLTLGGLGSPAEAGHAAERDGAAATAERGKTKKKVKHGLLTLRSTDGSAALGLMVPFTLTPQTGAPVDVLVTGMGPSTKQVQRLKPGLYTVSTTASALDGTVYSVDSLSGDGTVTVPKPKKKKRKTRPGKVALTFSVAAQVPDLAVSLDEASVDRLALSWTGPSDVTAYELRRTEGSRAAASVADGVAVPLDSPTATSAVDTDVAPGQSYTYTLFATSPSGAVAPASMFGSVPSLDGLNASFSVSPGTVLVTDLAAARPTALGDGKVAVTIGSSSTRTISARATRSALSSVQERPWHREAAGDCLIGSAYLADTTVAGDDAFFGLVEDCEGSRAVVDTNVPLTDVFETFETESNSDTGCLDFSTGQEGVCDLDADSDGDGLTDGEEAEFGTDPNIADVDNDGLDDGQEREQYTDPYDPDTDNDLVSDGQEVMGGEVAAPTMPWNDDTDDDGILDGYELRIGSDPTLGDTDGDGVEDLDQIDEGRHPATGEVVLDETGEPALGDADLDTVSDAMEILLGLDRFNPDSDLDTLDDDDETSGFGGDALVEDTDGDGESDAQEVEQGSDPIGPLSTSVLSYSYTWYPGEDEELGRELGRRGKVSCSGGRDVDINLNLGYNLERSSSLKLEGARLDYSFRFVNVFSANPRIEFIRKVECSINFPSLTIPITYTPVPVNVEITPVLSGEAKAGLKLTGPRLELRAGMEGSGFMAAGLKKCTWLKIPCGVNFDNRQEFKPILGASAGPAKVEIFGSAGIKAGLQGFLAIGKGERFAAARAGFVLGLYPLTAGVESKRNFRCAELGIKAALELKARAEVWVLNPRFGFVKDIGLIEKEIPIKSFEIGDC